MEFDKKTSMAILTDHEAECSGLVSGVPIVMSASLLERLIDEASLAESITSESYRAIARGVSMVLRNMRDQYNMANS